MKNAIEQLKAKYQFPIRFDGDDLLAADNRIIVWGKEDANDHDDISASFGRAVALVLNELAADPPIASLLVQHWQPMETAPMDGTRLLMVNAAFGSVRVAWYDEPHESWSYSGVYQPTHWMPLPESPTSPLPVSSSPPQEQEK